MAIDLQTVSVDTSPQPLLKDSPERVLVQIRADWQNDGDVFIGNENVQPVRLKAGNTFSMRALSGRIYVRGNNPGDSFYFIIDELALWSDCVIGEATAWSECEIGVGKDAWSECEEPSAPVTTLQEAS